MAQVATGSTVHDVVVVGSGAGGGTVTKVLADLGVSVLLHGSRADAEHGRPQGAHVAVQRAASRRRRRRARPTRAGRRGFTYSATYGGAQLAGEPYTVAPGSDFSWFRSRDSRRPHQPLRPRHAAVGRLRLQAALDATASAWTGRSATRTSRRTTTRPSASSASPARAEGIRSAPDGIFHTPAPLRAHDMLVQRACAKLGHPRRRRAPGGHHRRPGTGGPACHYCGQCGRGCMTASNYAVELRADLPGDEDRPRAGRRQRDGARADHRRHRQGHGRLLHRQDRPAPSSRCAAARSCSRRARANRRGCCSTRSRRGIRRGSRTRPARSAAT